MKPNANLAGPKPPRRPLGPFRRAVLRGLAILLPPLLTIVIFLWVGNTVKVYLLEPLESGIRWTMIELADIRTPDVPGGRPSVGEFVVVDGGSYELKPRSIITIDGEDFQLVGDSQSPQFVPWEVHDYVKQRIGKDPMPTSAKEIYTRYIDSKWLDRRFVVPVFLCLFVLVLYLLGKFLAAGVGRFFWSQLERIIHRVPLVRNVYSSVKQVTDFMFTEPDVQYTRVVAVEYPRKGIWTTAFVTGESLDDIRMTAREPVLSVLIPTSPMPFTGFTVTVLKRETIDLDITLDEAFQFIVSCGVVVPPRQMAEALAKRGHGTEQEALALAAPVGGDD
jgi:uncharacterized membrane protein